MKRKTVLFVTNILTAAFGLLCMNKTVEDSPILVSLVLYVCFTMTSSYFSAISLAESETFSSEIRSTGVGIIFGVSNLARLVVPFVIGFLNERGIHTVAASSILILALGIVPIILLDETYEPPSLNEPFLAKGVQKNEEFDDVIRLKEWKGEKLNLKT